MRSALFTRLLLISVLLLAQVGSLTHAISHFSGAAQGSDQSLPHEKHCDLCAAYAQIGSAVNTPNINFVSTENHVIAYLPTSSSYISSTFTAFAARAPPYSA
jgi:hypothetical protein